MTRLATTPAILGIFVSGLVAAGLPAGCGSNKVEIGLQNIDAQAPGLDAPAGSGGAGGTGSTATAGGNGGGVTATGGSTRTGGTTSIGSGGNAGVIASGGAIGSGGASASGGTTGTGTGCAPGWTPCCGQCLSPAAGICAPCPPAGGAGSTGGATRTGGTTGAGGTTPAGGTTGAGGATRTGGTTALGGTTGTGGAGGATGATCGGLRGMTCSPGQFCDLLAGSCNVSDATGTCVANAGLGCITIYQPVCGCDGKTYSSDCDRQRAGVSKKSDGACATADAGVCPAGQTWCPGCASLGIPAGCGQVCTGAPCPVADGGTGDAARTCGQVTTQAECDSRSDCHSVFVDPGTCGCAGAGCCARFNRCADGDRATCNAPAAFGCTIATPFCEAPYVLSYTANCYEGCVRQSECAGADAGAPPTCPSTPPTNASSCSSPSMTCFYDDCPSTGRTQATCTGGTWSVQTAACGTVSCTGYPYSGGMTCPSGQMCLISVGGALLVRCIDNACGQGPVTSQCSYVTSGCSMNATLTTGVTFTCNSCPVGVCA